MGMYRSSSEIVAYIDDCVLICQDCVTTTEANELYPVFLGVNEADTIHTCERCEIPIETTLTSDGIAYFKTRGFTGDSSDIYNALLDIYIERQKEN